MKMPVKSQHRFPVSKILFNEQKEEQPLQVIYKDLKCPMSSVTHSSGEGAKGGRRHSPKNPANQENTRL